MAFFYGMQRAGVPISDFLSDEEWPSILYPSLPWQGSSAVSSAFSNVDRSNLHGIHVDSYLMKSSAFESDEKSDTPYWVCDAPDTKWAKTTQGTLVFPTHAREGSSLSFSVDDLIETVTDLCPPPYSVSLFHLEQESPAAERYRAAGWRVVSFGPRNSPEFLIRQYAELLAHDRVVGNQMQSALLYGGLLRRKMHVIELDIDLHAEDEVARSRQGAELLDHTVESRKLWPTIFDGTATHDQSFEIAADELGWHQTLSGEDLTHALGWTSPIRRSAARVFAAANDLRFGSKARRGTFVTGSRLGGARRHLVRT
jgi:hypothetical protein